MEDLWYLPYWAVAPKHISYVEVNKVTPRVAASGAFDKISCCLIATTMKILLKYEGLLLRVPVFIGEEYTDT